MPLYDALYGHAIRHVLMRHEASAVFAACGFARAGETVGVCCATSGPGAANLITGLVDAAQNGIPVVAITGQVRKVLMGTDGFQEADVCALSQSFTKASWLVLEPALIYARVREACALARAGQPGPVLVDIPTDVLRAPYRADVPQPRALAPQVTRSRTLEALPRAAIVMTDTGVPGSAFPAAIGACFACPGRDVFAVCDEASFQLALPELVTLKRHGVRVKIVVTGERAAADSGTPDLRLIAAAYGVASFTVRRDFLAYDGSALLHAVEG